MVSERATPGFAERITSTHLPRILSVLDPPPTRRITGAGLAGATITTTLVDLPQPTPSLRSQLADFSDLAGGRGILFTLDEISLAATLGVDAQYMGFYRQRLLDAGVIYPVKHGVVDIALPYLREYLRDHVVTDATTDSARRHQAFPSAEAEAAAAEVLLAATGGPRSDVPGYVKQATCMTRATVGRRRPARLRQDQLPPHHSGAPPSQHGARDGV